MEWWAWLLIAIGVIALGAVKLIIFNKIKESKKKKTKFTDED